MSWFNFRNKKSDNKLVFRKLEGTVSDEFLRSLEERSCPAQVTSESLTFESLLRSQYSYRSLSALYACIELISNSLSSIPLRVVEEDEHGHRQVVKHHPLQRIFRDKNIQICSMQTTIKCAIQDVLIHGNGYILIERGETGLVNSLRYIPAGQVSPQYNQSNNTLYYWISLLDKDVKKTKFSPKDVIHLKKDTRDGVTGQPVSLYAKDVIELAKSAEEAAKSFFDSGMNVSGLLACKQMLNEQQRRDLKASWQSSGGRNSLQVLPVGVDYVQLGVDSAKGQLLESRQYETVEIARYYGVPVQLIQSGDKLTYNNLEQLNLLFFQHTLLPYIRNIETEFTRKLFYDDDNLIVDMDEDEFLLRTDKASTASYLSTLVGGGIMTVNEARKELGLSEMESGNDLHIAYSDASKAEINNDNDA